MLAVHVMAHTQLALLPQLLLRHSQAAIHSCQCPMQPSAAPAALAKSRRDGCW